MVSALQNWPWMRVLILLIIICAITPSFHLLETVANRSLSMQQSCTNLFSETFRHRDLARGFICGTSITDAKNRNTFQQTSLIHLMVVSGGHLQILTFLLLTIAPVSLKRHTFYRFFIWIFLLFYCLATGFQAPVVRAFLSRVIAALGKYGRWNWDLGKVQIAAGVLSLILFPVWIHSFSFFLYWLASMGFLLIPLCFPYRNRRDEFSFKQVFLTCALIQAFVAVVFGSFSWLGILMNAVFAAPLAILLCGISLAPLLVPPLIPFCDQIWDWLLNLLEKTLPLASPASDIDFSKLQWFALWGLLVLLQVATHLIYSQRYRSSHV
ncbi:MAG: ComEC/Rec2 family competence protein [Pseudobdellovibrionaceae bacterium]